MLINKASLEHSRTHPLMYCLGPLLCYNSRAEYLQRGLPDTQSQAYLLSGPSGKHLARIDLVQRRHGGKEEMKPRGREPDRLRDLHKVSHVPLLSFLCKTLKAHLEFEFRVKRHTNGVLNFAPEVCPVSQGQVPHHVSWFPSQGRVSKPHPSFCVHLQRGPVSCESFKTSEEFDALCPPIPGWRAYQ